MIQIEDIEDTTVEELCLLYLLKNDKLDSTMRSLKKKGYYTDKITQIGTIELKLGVKVKETSTESIRELAKEYRKLFKGKKPGAISTIEACMLAFKQFKEEYNYTDDEILKAAENYVKSEIQNDYQYLQRADRVIYHVENGIPTSKLATFCEELNNEDDEGYEWTESI